MPNYFQNTPNTLPVDKTASKTTQNIQRVIFGDEPIQSYQERFKGAEQTAKDIGIKQNVKIAAVVGVLGTDALNFIGGEGKAAELIGTLAKESDVAKVTDHLVNAGFAKDVAEAYAPKIAAATDKKVIEEAISKATDLQLGTTTSGLGHALPSELQPVATRIQDSNITREQFVTEVNQALHEGTDAEKAAATDTLNQLKKANLTLDEFYAKATGTEAAHAAAALPEEIQSTIQSIRQEVAQTSPVGGNVPPEVPPINNKDVVAQFTKALQEAKPIREEQQAIYSAEKSKQAGNILAARETTSGRQGFYAELGQLKGTLPKVDFESLAGKITPESIDQLFNMVRDSKALSPFDTISARKGLEKMFGELGGQVPTRSEIKLLERVFPKETVAAMLEKRSLLARVADKLSQAIGLTKALRATLDLSAAFRQGLVLVGRKEFWQSFASMFKQFGSEKAFQAVQESISKLPTYDLMVESKLPLTGIDGFLTPKEEAYVATQWAEKIPLVGRAVRASDRAYTGFLNMLRATTFNNMIQDAKTAGIEITPKLTKDLSSFLGAATGRGGLGRLEPIAGTLSTAIFSPRLTAARLQLLNPVYYAKLDPFVRKQALKSMLALGGIATTLLTLAKLAGADVVTDPTNADFGKIKVKAQGGLTGALSTIPGLLGVGVQTYGGKSRFDILGGFQQYIRLAAQLQQGKITSSTTGKVLELGKGYKPITRKDIIERFFQGKASPIASFVINWLQGQDVTGKPFHLLPNSYQDPGDFLNLFIPLITQDITDAINPAGTSSTPPKSSGTKNRLNL